MLNIIIIFYRLKINILVFGFVLETLIFKFNFAVKIKINVIVTSI